MVPLFALLGGSRVYVVLAVLVSGLLLLGGVGLLWSAYSKSRAEIGRLGAELQNEQRNRQRVESAFADYRREARAKIVEVERVNVKREVVYVETTGAKEIIVKEVPAAVAGYPELPPALRVLHDAAASGCRAPSADPAAGRDAAPVSVEDFASTVVENYCSCERTRQQVVRLQGFLADMAKETGQ